MNGFASQGLYKTIVLGINSDELIIWAKEVVSEKASEIRTAAQIKRQNKKKGVFGRMFGGKQEEQTEEQKIAEIENIQQEIEDHA